MTTDLVSQQVLGVILAGGRSSRMGGPEKSLMQLAGKPLIAHVHDRLAPQVARVIVNANGETGRFASLGLPVQPDTVPGFAGPLAGILAGMRWAEREAPDLRFIVTAATDTPFLPCDLVRRLAAATGLDEDAVAMSGSAGNRHPVIGLWPVAMARDLDEFLHSGEGGKVMRFVDRHHRIDVEFAMRHDDGMEFDPFFNVNTPQDLEVANKLAMRLEET